MIRLTPSSDRRAHLPLMARGQSSAGGSKFALRAQPENMTAKMRSEQTEKRTPRRSSPWKTYIVAGAGLTLVGAALLWHVLRRRGDGDNDAGDGADKPVHAAPPLPAIEDETPVREGHVIKTHMRLWWTKQALQKLMGGAPLGEISALSVDIAAHANGTDRPSRDPIVVSRGYSVAFAELITRLAYQFEHGHEDSTQEACAAHLGAYLEAGDRRTGDTVSMRVALHALLDGGAQRARVIVDRIADRLDGELASMQNDGSKPRDMAYSELGIIVALHQLFGVSIVRALPVANDAERKALLEKSLSTLERAHDYFDMFDLHQVMPPSIGAYLEGMRGDIAAEIEKLSGGAGGVPSGGGGGGPAKYVTTSGVVVEDHTHSAVDMDAGAQNIPIYCPVPLSTAGLVGAVKYPATFMAFPR